jgi:hypothetical protein
MTMEPFRLVWEFRGRIRGKRFAAFAELEELSRCLLDAGLVPWVPHDSPCPLGPRPPLRPSASRHRPRI